MRRWGLMITLGYAVFASLFLVPLAAFLLRDANYSAAAKLKEAYSSWGTWLFVLILAAGQALLLFLSVDTSFRKLKPGTSVVVSCLLTAAMAALLTAFAILSLGFAIRGDRFGGHYFDDWFNPISIGAAIWLLWAVLFFMYFRNPSSQFSQAASWILRGSVLELLIAVPAHVIVRRRDDCSAPVATSFGIVTGIAIMFLCFGPSVLLLYKKRLDEYPKRKAAVG